MKVLLIDIDSKIPNLALMQISAYHISQGDKIYFKKFNYEINDPDIVYISCIFKKNAWKTKGLLKHQYPNADIHIGGSGVSWDWLPKEMQKIKPDYDLYPNIDYSMGFTTRGCIRCCQFCIVRDKEGPYHRWQHVKEFHDEKFKIIQLLDNNWYADKEWFFENTQYIIDHKLKVIENGMDIGLLDQEIASRLHELKWAKPMKFAFDHMHDEKAVEKGIEILKQADINIRQIVQFYVLVGYDTTFEEDIYRCQKLKEWGTNAFVMPFKKTKDIRDLARWANRKWIFWSCDFKDYKRGTR